MFKRKKFLTNKKYQLKYILIILGFMTVTIFIGAASFYWSLSGSIEDAILKESFKDLIWRILFLFIGGTVIGMFFSHKLIGPVGRIEVTLKDIKEGKFKKKLILRQNDEFAKISQIVNEIGEKEQEKKKLFDELNQEVNKIPSSDEKEKIKEILDKIK